MLGLQSRNNPWLQAEQIGDVTVVRLNAKTILDEDMVQRIGQQLYSLVDNAGQKRIVLDFSVVERLTSTMFGKLIALHKKVQAQDGRLVLCRVNPQVYEIFEILKLPKLLNICGDEQEALQSF